MKETIIDLGKYALAGLIISLIGTPIFLWLLNWFLGYFFGYHI